MTICMAAQLRAAQPVLIFTMARAELILLLQIIVICIHSVLSTNNDSSLVVQINQGKLRGQYGTAISGRKFVEFLGVRYAKLNRRFQPAGPAENWEGVRNATDYGSKCGQFEAPDSLQGSEDCLFLNIHTPALADPSLMNASLPIVVFLHGGSFQFGGYWESFGPEYLMEADVVYVSVNYRLGALGFLSTGDGLASGNNGLKDQVMALRFIQQNIGAFGGDPERVSIIGESAGGAAASYHLLSPMSKGLFSSAVSISGSALCPWALARNPTITFKKLANSVNCTSTTTSATLACLEALPYETILRHQALLKWFRDPIASFGPVVERWNTTVERFLTESPQKLLSTGQISNKVPWVLGDVKDEGLLLHAASILKNVTLTQELDQEWYRIAPLTLMYDEVLLPNEQDFTSAAIRDYYFGNKSISNETEQNLADLYSDRFFVYPVQKAARLYAASGAPTYLYLFTYAGEYTNVEETPGNPKKIVSHGDDIQYLLHATFRPNFPSESTSSVFTREYITLMASVAAKGLPAATWGNATVWPALSSSSNSSLAWYRLDVDTSVEENVFEDRVKFWDTLPLTAVEDSA